ncbi:hypothetical protein FRC12_010923 [Ceratobasidium sp. 428]|nr:hypothetical protein FRC12_010923 [Ceratobasidium sp. 428]
MAARMDGVSCPPRASIAGTDVPACPQVARIGNPPYPTERIARPSRACPIPSHPFVPDTQSARDVIDVKYPTLSTHFQTPHRRRVSHSATPAHRSEASYDARYFPVAFDVENTHIPELETNSRGIENEGRTCRNEITRSPQKRTRGLSTQQVQQVQQAQQHAEDMAYLQSLINDKERLKRVQSSLPHIATSAGSLFAEILSELSKSAHGSEYEYSEWKTECNSASTSAEGRANDLGQRIDRLEAEGRAKNHPTQNSRRAARVREDPSRNSHGELHLGDTGTYSAARRDNSRTRIKFERKVKKLKRKAKQRRRANIELKEPTPYQGQVNYDEFELWSYQVDQWLSEIGFKGRKAVRYLGTFLEGKASQWYMCYVAPNPEEYTVDSLKASLFGYFFPANFKSELRNEFSQAQQGEHRFIDYLRLLQRFQRRLPDISDLQLCIKLCDTVHTYIKIGWIEAGMDPEKKRWSSTATLPHSSAPPPPDLLTPSNAPVDEPTPPQGPAAPTVLEPQGASQAQQNFARVLLYWSSVGAHKRCSVTASIPVSLGPVFCVLLASHKYTATGKCSRRSWTRAEKCRRGSLQARLKKSSDGNRRLKVRLAAVGFVAILRLRFSGKESTDLETLSIAAQRFETAKTIKDLLVTHADDNSDGYRADYDAYESQSDCSEAETAGPGPDYEADRSNPGTGDNSDVESKYSAESSASDAGQSDTENDASDDRGAYGLDYEDQSDPDHEETGDSESEPDVEPGAASRYEPGHDEYSSMYAEPGTELHPSEANQSDGEDIDAYYLEYEEGKSVASGYSSDTESDSSYLSKPLRSLEGRM